MEGKIDLVQRKKVAIILAAETTYTSKRTKITARKGVRSMMVSR